MIDEAKTRQDPKSGYPRIVVTYFRKPGSKKVLSIDSISAICFALELTTFIRHDFDQNVFLQQTI